MSSKKPLPITGRKSKIELMIWVNFKTYENGTGEKAIELAKVCQQAEKETSVKIIPVVQTTDIWRISQLGVEIWAQHVDNINYGPHTSQTLLEAVVGAGAKGTLLNHSERKLSLEVVRGTVERCKAARCKVLVCAETVEEGQKIAQFKPDFIAFEPPELIGGQISVSQAKPEIITDFIKEIPNIPILVGAGINYRLDIKKSLELGAVGVIVSHAVAKSDDPQKVLLELAEGFK